MVPPGKLHGRAEELRSHRVHAACKKRARFPPAVASHYLSESLGLAIFSARAAVLFVAPGSCLLAHRAPFAVRFAASIEHNDGGPVRSDIMRSEG